MQIELQLTKCSFVCAANEQAGLKVILSKQQLKGDRADAKGCLNSTQKAVKGQQQ